MINWIVNLQIPLIKNPWKRKPLAILLLPYLIIMHFQAALRITFVPNFCGDWKAVWKGVSYD